jgi:DUF4097 and DUF4098 domain-containing protein YvlB
MRRFTFAMVVLVLAVAPSLYADEWSKTFTLSGKPELRVETSDANIHVDTWDQNKIEAHVSTTRWKIGEDGITILDHQTGDSVEIEIRFPHRHFVFEVGQHRVEVEIHMPREGKISVHTGDGNIRLSKFKGDIDLETSDGSQEIEGVDGSLRARSSDGHIRVGGRFDVLELSTGDGRIEARAITGSTMAAGWDLHTGDGSVSLQLPETLNADVDLHTGDGHITLDLPITVQGQLGDKNIRGKLNAGGNSLRIHTGDGSIRLEKSLANL